MTPFASTCSSCRPALSLVRPITAIHSQGHAAIRHASQMSAIHRGLRSSHKAKPQGFTGKNLRPDANTSRRRQDPNWSAPGFKIKRGKKDVTDKGPRPEPRAGRFNNPNESFGKQSLVYHLRQDSFTEKLATLAEKKARAAGNERLSKDDFMREFSDLKSPEKARPGSKTLRKRMQDTIGKANVADSPPPRAARPAVRPRGGSFGRNPGPRSFDRQSRDSRPAFPSNKLDKIDNGLSKMRRSEPGAFDRPKRDAVEAAVPRSFPPGSDEGPAATPQLRIIKQDPYKDDSPIRVRHTTAASQFLYGQYVVKAALQHSQRQLYHLYIYAGANRQNLGKDASLERLADNKGIKITKVHDGDGLRMMDKMSEGRPHNGFVLEASPLPQRPLKCLGAVSEDHETPGFSLELAHQTSEDVAINGDADFVSHKLSSGRKPFVLLLDGIQDPANLGAILRTAAFLGVNAVAITKDNSATLTPVALKASAGASELLTLFSVKSTIDFINRSKEWGWLTYAAVPYKARGRGNSYLTLDRVETYDPLATQPAVLVLGSEGEGLTKQIRRQADFEVAIPNSAGLFNIVDSLNVSVAAGILCNGFLKKQHGFIEQDEDTNDGKEEEAMF